MATKIDTVYIGESLIKLVENVPATINYDEDGIAKASLTYTCKYEVAPVLVNQIRVHPDFDWLRFKTATITRQPGCLAQVKVNFEGIPDPTGEDEEDEEDTSTKYSLRGTSSNEPIETHPDFEDFAGTPGLPLNGARWTPKGMKGQHKFEGFIDEAGNALYGVKSYLEGGFIFSETRLVPKKDAFVIAQHLNNIGKRLRIPDGHGMGNLNGHPQRDWLQISCDVEPVGTGFKVTRNWRLSGVRKWNKDIYPVGAKINI
tara:strand:+ start:21879 stop:22652 length:774 start_codon:yes stop_codon:yes gene_type:complete